LEALSITAPTLLIDSQSSTTYIGVASTSCISSRAAATSSPGGVSVTGGTSTSRHASSLFCRHNRLDRCDKDARVVGHARQPARADSLASFLMNQLVRVADVWLCASIEISRQCSSARRLSRYVTALYCMSAA
jgi:hypothetical protein